MARLSSLWRDLGLNLVLRCLTGSALMWLSNRACRCLAASQRAASFQPGSGLRSAFQVVLGEDARVEACVKEARPSSLPNLSNIGAIKPNGLSVSGNASMKDVGVPHCVNMYMIYLAASCKCKRSAAYATRGTLMAR